MKILRQYLHQRNNFEEKPSFISEEDFGEYLLLNQPILIPVSYENHGSHRYYLPSLKVCKRPSETLYINNSIFAGTFLVSISVILWREQEIKFGSEKYSQVIIFLALSFKWKLIRTMMYFQINKESNLFSWEVMV